jgi:hypothetical protein
VELRGDIQCLDHRERDGGRLNLEDDAVDAGGKGLGRAVLILQPAQ